MSRELFEPRVEAGIAFLSEHRPGFSERIALDRLEMFSTSRCVLAQMEGTDYFTARNSLGLDQQRAVALGFVLDPSEKPYDYGVLTDIWREKLKKLGSPAA